MRTVPGNVRTLFAAWVPVDVDSADDEPLPTFDGTSTGTLQARCPGRTTLAMASRRLTMAGLGLVLLGLRLQQRL
jgi:hypothetical protein